ncbi:MAG: pyrroloquinoline quinone-dependent dehydrogenase [Acidobacteriaceae bacterium]
MKRRSPWLTVAILCVGAVVFLADGAQGRALQKTRQTRGWPVYGGQPTGDHYSPLAQINRGNVAKLRVAWTFDTGEQGGLETSPIIVGRILYGYTPTQKVIALDAATGRLIWKFDSGITGTAPARGVAYWSDGRDGRIFAGVMNYLYALDAATGKPVSSFGENGRIDLRKGLGRDYETQSIALTTPGLIYKNLIIVGGRDPETHPAPPGTIRAFDVRTGALRWQFHTIPHPGEPGYDTWPKDAWKTAGAANNWAGMALDARRGILYVPTGSAVFDFYGGDRVGNDLFADTLLALDAGTGHILWYFQGVHHDLWDRDFPSPPALLTVVRSGRKTDAVAQTTKQGYIYVFDRVTGRPLFPIQEERYPASGVPGEVTSPTQPRPVLPEPFARQSLTADMLTNRTPQAHRDALKRFLSFRSGGQFVPFALGRQTVVFPGFDGGAEWGGPAIDPKRGVIYVNSNEMAWTGGLTAQKPAGKPGAEIYQNECSVCHGEDRTGSPPTFPSLVGIEKRLSPEQIRNVIHNGKGRMPAFDAMSDAQVNAVLDYLKDGSEPKAAARAEAGAQYRFTGYRKFLDIDGYPAIAPPWGTLNAIDLNTGKYLWKIPFGEYPALARQGMTNTGSENYGGPIVTASGLVFIGATVYDRQMHAFDSSTGKLLWHATLPYSGVATPATYMIDGKQYVVIAAGGGRDGKASGGVYVAFSLP